MAALCDIQVIKDNFTQQIGDNGEIIWEQSFNCGDGLVTEGEAVLMLMVKGLTQTLDNADAVVKINDTSVGVIENYNGADSSHWFTQIIDIESGILESSNKLSITAVPYEGAEPGNLFDDFRVKDVVCFFSANA